MSWLIALKYECGCESFGNPENICPKHNKSSIQINGVEVKKCFKCKRNIEVSHQFYWKTDKSVEGFRIQHVHCMIGKRGWSLCTEGKYKHVKYKEPESRVRESVELIYNYF